MIRIRSLWSSTTARAFLARRRGPVAPSRAARTGAAPASGTASVAPIPPEPRRILLLALGSIGEVLAATPAMRALRRRYPTATIVAWVAAWAADALEGTGLADQIVTAPCPWRRADGGEANAPWRWPGLLAAFRRLRRFEPDIAIDLVGDPRALALARLAGVARLAGLDPAGPGAERLEGLIDVSVPPDPSRHAVAGPLALAARLGAPSATVPAVEVGFAPADEGWAARLVPRPERTRAGSDTLTVVLHPSAPPHARWSPAGWAMLARRLAAEPEVRLVVVGPGRDRRLVATIGAAAPERSVIATGRMGPRRLAAVVGRADLLVAADHWVLHLADATETPTVAIMRPSAAAVRAPLEVPVRTVAGERCCGAAADAPCTLAAAGSPSACLAGLPATRVWTEVRLALDAIRAGRPRPVLLDPPPAASPRTTDHRPEEPGERR